MWLNCNKTPPKFAYFLDMLSGDLTTVGNGMTCQVLISEAGNGLIYSSHGVGHS